MINFKAGSFKHGNLIFHVHFKSLKYIYEIHQYK